MAGSTDPRRTPERGTPAPGLPVPILARPGAAPRLLFVDTETTGLPRNWRAPASDTANWPRAVQIAWELADISGTVLDAASLVIRPDGFEIPVDAVRVHGITTERALAEGVPLDQALDTLDRRASEAGVLVAHNIDFDRKILDAELHRQRRQSPLPALPTFCTMKTTSAVCRIPGKRGYKWPNLDELHQHLFGEPVQNAHDAGADVAACRRSFFELLRRGVYRLDIRA